ncbi:hypothetical protein C8R41DRAFT_867059 [Lentinula lateritia]|uniref:Uncharacterized protein n=1 Tax=Lentinula lateritia TaxID=40482 RepID=A0ABQ8VH46_9AGAR|nr:hypothetical protein C8R41DRAFT_867059 [Lentinula lateritia]
MNHSVSAEPAISSNELEFSSQELFELDADPLANNTEDDPNIEQLTDTGRITSGLIKDVHAKLGSKLDKWKVPSTISNKFKNQCKAKQMEGLEPQPCEDSSDDKDNVPSVRPRAKKARMSQKIAADKENDDEYELTAYIVVQNKDVAAGSSHRKKAVVENSSTMSGPISILSSHTYNDFLCAIGACVKCPVHHLVLHSMSYCPQTPKTSVPLPVGTKDAFQAMQSFFRSCSHSSVSGALNVFITMEKPIKPLDKTVDWEMDEKVFDSDNAFTSTFVTAQKVFCKVSVRGVN